MPRHRQPSSNPSNTYDSSAPPIPTYEEAIQSRSSHNGGLRGPSEVSDDAERQGLLYPSASGLNGGQGSNGSIETSTGTRPDDSTTSRGTRRVDGLRYVPPTVESARESLESGYTSPELDDEDDREAADLQQDMEHFEVLEPDSRSQRRAARRARIRLRLHKRFALVSDTLSSLGTLMGRVRQGLPRFSSSSSSSSPSSSSSCFGSFCGMGRIRAYLPCFNPEYHAPWPIFARLFGLFILVTSVYLLFIFRGFMGDQIGPGMFLDNEDLRHFVQELAANDAGIMAHYLRELTKEDHVAGTKGDFYLAEWVRERFQEAGLDDVSEDLYYVYLNYPTTDGRRVAIIEPPELAWEADLEEPPVQTDLGNRPQTLAFHGHSRSGNVTGPLIYANYGSKEDFAKLQELGVDVTDAIVLVRYYGTQGDRAMKVREAELAGAAGCLIYSDPADDGFVQGEPWPKGPWRTRDGLQRGAVSLMSWVVGDVLTPGWASTEDAQRISKDNNSGLVNIPSLPLAWRDAKPLLQALRSHGHLVPAGWAGGVPHVDEWWTGDAVSSPTVHLQNLQDEVEKQPIKNIIGVARGWESPEKAIYVGNHRDSWCFGATDPGTGTAVLLEMVRIFGRLLETGWRPRRTIVFASWDGEEYNLIGSTEHVEERIDEIRRQGVAYINVDLGVSGHEFWAAASPVFRRPLMRALNRVTDPQTNLSLRHLWDKGSSMLEGLGAGSDYVAFQSLAGTSSLDFGFRGAEPHAYPYHSCYDGFEFVRDMLDPDFSYHSALAQVMSLIVLDLADEAILPFDFPHYAREMQRYVGWLQRDIEQLAQEASIKAASAPDPASASVPQLNLTGLQSAVRFLHERAQDFDKWSDKWESQLTAAGMMETHKQSLERLSHNARMSEFETHLLDLRGRDIYASDEDSETGDQPSDTNSQDLGGIPGRQQFKHVVFGPSIADGYQEAYFPFVRDALARRDWDAAQAALDLTAGIVQNAAAALEY